MVKETANVRKTKKKTVAAPSSAAQEESVWALTEGQREAEEAITQWFFNESRQFFVLSGFAGTGKTFLLAHLVRYALHLNAGEEAAFIAPTGKAAAVLVKNGTPAGTVHSLIYTLDEDDFEVDENGEIVRSGKPQFVRREKIDEKIKLIVVDEASMVDETLLSDILAFGVKCLFCGDRAQLPPVRGENVILSRVDFSLTQIVRQAEDNPILTVAHAVREGEYLSYGNYGGKVLILPRSSFTGERRLQYLLAADQIICGRNATRVALNEEIRAYKGFEGSLPQDGEKLICTLNDWEKPLDGRGKFFLVNGVIGIAKNVQKQGKGLASMDFYPDFVSGFVRVPFDTGIFKSGDYRYYYGDRAMEFSDGTFAHEGDFRALAKKKIVHDEPVCRFEFAYAITCHKAQGSEFNYVIVFDESWAFGEERRRWLYTAVTRAKDKLIIVR
ncbi:MAG: AAA family ATPase [Candidatus Borkfalkiaceae bacterium]|nr:AAA family ATPase [Clostridia bacterium]MDY6224060.1 AAA family ATPase [Christensenellaceae bacterium]